MKLSDEQKLIVEIGVGKHGILACPGTGKTATLSHRVAYLVNTGKIKAEQCLIFSYTRKAAEEIAMRTAKLLGGKKEEEDMPISGTVHSFCYNEVLDYTGQRSSSRVITNLNEMALFELEIIEGTIDGSFEEYIDLDPVVFKDLIWKYNNALEFRDTGCQGLLFNLVEKGIEKTMNDMICETRKKNGNHSAERFLSYLVDLSKYEIEVLTDGILSIMVAQGVYTFSSMIMIYYKLIDSREHHDYVVESLSDIKYLVVDEVQDLGRPEIALIKKLSSIIGQCMICGDPAQVIFRETLPEDLLTLLSTTDFKLLTLNEGHRCPPGIARVSNIIRKEIMLRPYARKIEIEDSLSLLRPNTNCGNIHGRVRMWIYNTKADHKDVIYDAVKRGLAVGDSSSRCFMARTNYQVKEINGIIKDTGRKTSINHSHVTWYSHYHLLVAASIYHLTRFTSTPSGGKQSALGRFKMMAENTASASKERTMIFRIFQKLSLPFLAEVILAGNSRASLKKIDLNRRAMDTIPNITSAINLLNLEDTDNVKYLKLIAGSQRSHRVGTTIRIIKTLCHKANKTRAKKGGPDAVIRRIARNISKIQEDDNRDRLIESAKIEVMKYLLELTRSGRFLSSGVEDSITYESADGRLKNQVSLEEEKNVTVVDTIHSRKGLEYDYVNIILPATRQLIRSKGNSYLFTELCAEYVALTRARVLANIFIYPDTAATPIKSNDNRITYNILRNLPTVNTLEVEDFKINIINKVPVIKQVRSPEEI